MDSAKGCATRQVVDIPIPIMAEVLNHLQMQVKCSCGHCCKGQFPKHVNAPVSYGPNIIALTSYLSTYQNIPFKRLTHLYEAIFGLHISEGSVSNMLDLLRDSVHQRNQGNIGPEIRQDMESRLDELLARPPVYTNDDDKETELDKLKVSGCFRTETGVENYATVGSVIQTAVKNGQNPFEVLQVIATLRQE